MFIRLPIPDRLDIVQSQWSDCALPAVLLYLLPWLRLALESGSGVYHAVAEEGIPVRKIAEAIGQNLDVPTASKSPTEAAKLFRWLTAFVKADNPVSSLLTRERLRWQPTHPDIFSDLQNPNQFSG